MPGVPADERDGKPPFPTVVRPRERPDRPPTCTVCRGPAWWNGWRVVFPVVAAVVAGVLERWELPLPLAKCSQCRHGFTCYPDGIYPRRQYQLDAVAGAVASVVLGGASVAAAARTMGAGPTTVRRWLAWIAVLAEPRDLVALAARVDPDSPAGAGLSSVVAAPSARRAGAAAVLVALEHLGAALVRGGLRLMMRSGLGRVLGWQHQAHGEAVLLTRPPSRLSPAMALWREAALA